MILKDVILGESVNNTCFLRKKLFRSNIFAFNRLTGCFYLLDQDKRYGSYQLQCYIADAFIRLIKENEKWKRQRLLRFPQP